MAQYLVLLNQTLIRCNSLSVNQENWGFLRDKNLAISTVSVTR